jgi:hypothetical protein
MWLQGINNAPQVVQMCINSMKKNLNGNDLIILDENNIDDYISIPWDVKKKFEDGVFTKTLLSDIVRCSLLAENGGLWLDATVFVSKPIVDNIKTTPFFTVVRNEAKELDISNKISPFLIGGSDKKLFCFMRDMLYEYVRSENDLINYLLIENIFSIACEKDSKIKECVDILFDNKQDVLGLEKILEKPYKKEELNNILGQATFHKLSWKKKTLTQTKNMQDTVYGFLIKQYNENG